MPDPCWVLGLGAEDPVLPSQTTTRSHRAGGGGQGRGAPGAVGVGVGPTQLGAQELPEAKVRVPEIWETGCKNSHY